MVKQARTIDLAVAIGGSDWIVELTRVLDLSLDGSASTTQEAVLGQADEEASVHAVGQAFSFGTLYDGTETDALRSHSGDDSDSDPFVAVIEAKADLRSFEAARASVTGLAQTAPRRRRYHRFAGHATVRPGVLRDRRRKRPGV